MLKTLTCIILITNSTLLIGQDFNLKKSVSDLIIKEDKLASLKHYNALKKADRQQTVSIGGLFITPNFGFVFPMRDFGDRSNIGFTYGAKLEFAHTKIYPFTIGAFFEQQFHKGADEFKASNLINTYTVNITSVGGGVDIILNKYINSNFTIPFIILEGKYMNVSRTIEPIENNPGLPVSESIIGYTAGLGFTLYIFDIYSKYTFAKDFTNVSVNFRFRYPLVKF